MKARYTHLSILLASSLAVGGCATAHLRGAYEPETLPRHGGAIAGASEVNTLASGNDFVFFWGLFEVASSDLGDEVKQKTRPDVVLTDVEIRNHISLPGVLLWICTAGIVSHHDLDLRGRIATVIEDKPAPTTVEREKTVVVPAAPATPPERPPTVVAEKPAPGPASPVSDHELFVETTVDRPLDELLRDFGDAAKRAGLTPIADISWSTFTGGSDEDKGGIPQDRVEKLPRHKVHTEVVTSPALARDVTRDPKCGVFVPGIVVYEVDGRTNIFYVRPTAKLRELDASGRVGDGKAMTRAAFDEHMALARDYESAASSLIEELRTRTR